MPAAQRDALQSAARRVRSYHEAQKKACGESWSYRDADGTLLGQKVTPLDRVGIYVPGGKAAYPVQPADERRSPPTWPACPKSSWWCRRLCAAAWPPVAG